LLNILPANILINHSCVQKTRTTSTSLAHIILPIFKNIMLNSVNPYHMLLIVLVTAK